jgi:glutathione S-transferase
MNLYYAPAACSLADHIALIEADVRFKLIRVGRDKQTEDGRDFTSINPKGYTPALELDDGTILTENLTILLYIAETTGKLLAKNGLDRWRAIEVTNFLTTEIHKNFLPFFNPNAADPEKDKAREALELRFATVSEQLGDKVFLVGDGMSIADAYLYVMLMWAALNQIGVSETLTAYAERMKVAPSVSRALVEEGLA